MMLATNQVRNLNSSDLGSASMEWGLVAQMGKNPPAVQETWVPSMGWEHPLAQGMATHSSILGWRIPMDRGALVGCSPWGRKESDTTERLSTTHTLGADKYCLIPLVT